MSSLAEQVYIRSYVASYLYITSAFTFSWGDQNWQGGTSFGCQNWSGGTSFGGRLIFSLQVHWPAFSGAFFSKIRPV